MTVDRSQALFERAQKMLPGGVNSPVRAFKAVGGVPRFIERARGSRIFDVDGNEYIDYVCSWGPMILGHAHPAVVEAVQRAASRGTSYGAPTELEVELAQLVVHMVPSIEKVRFVNSGTEATMSAIRLARAFTGRAKIVKFAGCYHGHADALLAESGSGLATFGIPGTPGVTEGTVRDTLTAPYNDLDAVESLFDSFPGEIAAVIVEPVAGNMGVVPPVPGFLPGLRELTRTHGALLIFDEVITGFRLSAGGAQAYYDVLPDLTCLGKILGGGLPVGAYGGSKEIMAMVAPDGPVYQAGTLSGNPLAMAAGIATLQQLRQPGVYETLEKRTLELATGIEHLAREAGLALQVNRVASMMSVFFTESPVVDYTSARNSRSDLYCSFFHTLLESGVYLAPSPFEAAFVSIAHTERDLEQTLEAMSQAFKAIKP